ncbi:HlyD family efflux transporter periplasmic adaptor subunit [Curvibacter sp. CHRR-16]|uniref:HlyD family efflux transporter periplasmic adaptor subunit n=1 Tax=Curvibacter sp. CHRR-16 TaxID=2835872 RepID=UPI001BDAB5B4|nr:HlyD family efflux transporter periplasmic adaptor subunit [Curvibacter sp. CHRR-16]MBT0570722.1 HlyD family efflux transporter periplasmic adaptor subunit [Curvibacter sp. CHRR-16]
MDGLSIMGQGSVQPASDTKAPAWPALREELLLHEAPRQHDGAPGWTLEDPGRNLFFQIGWVEAEMLARWDWGDAQRIAQAISQETTLDVSAQEVTEFARFLQANHLTQERGPQVQQQYAQIARAQRSTHWLKWVLHHYLFFRIPLVRPDAFLRATLPWVRRIVINRQFAWLTAGVGGLGLWLVARQWDAFWHTFLHFFTLEGAMLAGLTLGATKVLHELGHAYAARHHGCRVATMGVAFMVMWPVLYTDTSGAWRLQRRRARLSIGAAGMLTEICIAAWAVLAWSFLPDGMLRSAAFMLATTTVLLTLAVNLNPFMRFDGYFLLSDALNVPNLQQRAFALGRWRLREWLFDFGKPKPEHFAPWRERALIAYALCVWIYRFFLFLGIAVLVYHVAFKVLGIVLFAVEIVVFVLRPIYTELRVWFVHLKQTGSAAWTVRSRWVLGLLFGGVVLALIPWPTRIDAPALMRSAQQVQLMAPAGARIARIAIQPGQAVRAGDSLLVLEAPALDYELLALEQNIRLLQWKSAFSILRAHTAASATVAQSELQAAQARYAVLQRQKEQLHIQAPFDGVVADMVEPLSVGEWVPAGEWLGTLAAPQTVLVEGYVAEAELGRLSLGAKAIFLAEDTGVGAMPVRVHEIAATATRRLTSSPELASPNGGAIAATQTPVLPGEMTLDGRAWLPEQAIYRVHLVPDADHALPRLQVLRGTVVIDGSASSFLVRLWSRAAAVLVRESGF